MGFARAVLPVVAVTALAVIAPTEAFSPVVGLSSSGKFPSMRR